MWSLTETVQRSPGSKLLVTSPLRMGSIDWELKIRSREGESGINILGDYR